MKTKKINSKLSLKKNTIANLESQDMKNLLGGVNIQVDKPTLTNQISCLNCFGTITCVTCEIQTCSISSALPPTNDTDCAIHVIQDDAIEKKY